ncbi:hypothetical protein D3C77_546260 [compost metagenome]
MFDVELECRRQLRVGLLYQRSNPFFHVTGKRPSQGGSGVDLALYTFGFHAHTFQASVGQAVEGDVFGPPLAVCVS